MFGNRNDPITLTNPHNWAWLTSRTPGNWRDFGRGNLDLAAHDMRGITNLPFNFIQRLKHEIDPTFPAPTAS